MTPSRDDIVQALINSDIIASDTRANAQIVGHNDREPFLCFADAVLTLLPGKTEQEVREEVAAEIEARANTYIELADRFGGYHQGIRSALQEAAKLARGGEQND